MERSGQVEISAGIGMLIMCLLIGIVEGSSLVGAAPLPYFLGWLVAYAIFLIGSIVAAVGRQPSLRVDRAVVVAVPVLGAAAVALLSPSRGGMSLILLVLSAALCAYHVGPRAITIVIVVNSLVVAAATAGLGPAVTQGGSSSEVLLATLLYVLLQAGTAAMVWSQQRLAEALRDVTVAHVQLRGTSALLEESSQARERLRISRELHDVLGHQLTVLSVELEVASHKVEGSGLEHVRRARCLAKELLGDVRTAVGSERTRHFDLTAALVRLTQDVPRPRVNLTVTPDIAVDDELATVVVRAVQEIATNAIRHSQAENLWIAVSASTETLRLDAHDDGQGSPHVTPGHGLNGMRERVESVGGQVRIDSARGFRVTVELPARRQVTA